MYLVLVPFWHRAPKTLGITYDKSEQGFFCYVNEVTFCNVL